METALSTLAQVFVGPLVGTISDHYVPAILEKIGIQWDVTEEMERLSDILSTIQDVLEDAEDKQTTSKPIRNWLRKLKDVAYDVEDILDVCATEALHDPESTGIINGADMVEKIKQLIDKLDKITEQRSKFNLINLTSTTRVLVDCRVDPRRETSSFPTELKMYGRDEEKECIVNLMVNNSINIAENLSIYAIAGIGGLGKTTLAQMIYNDNMVKNRFEIRRWVCVSENFEVKSLIRDIIQSGSNNAQPLDQLQRRLQNILSGKRFLLVLDDVWNEDKTKWERLKSSLTCGAKGSSIIVTTRSDKVASLMGSSHVCRPKMLSEEDCFSLFKHHAFNEGEGEHHPNLESIGQQIMRKCGGVPLAAKALGGLLRFQREEKEWLFVKESKLWDLPQDKEDSILPALLLSYKHLPQHLRQCFVYCSIFPKDYRMKKEVLIQLWMANGFLQPKGNMELEDIGNGIFNDLVWRGFFQEVTFHNYHGMTCKMHDLVHDLACSITRDECFSVVTNGYEKPLVVGRRNTTRHLAIDHDMLFELFYSLSMIQSLRTLLQLDNGRRYVISPLPLNFSNLIYLRVLDLSHSGGLETLPESIARLKLLRYLDLSQTRIALLSDEVFGNLINLQTLKLRECRNLEMLPGNMRKLTNLRHLDISMSNYNLLGMPVGMGQLKCLHMLSNFIVSEECGVEELQELDHLRGTLEITCIGNQIDLDDDSQNAILIRKQGIRDLRLKWSKTASQTNSSRNDKLIADALQPHPNIEYLEFHYYGGSDFPRWMNSTCLPSLVEISLGDCSKCKHLPTLGLLPHLKKLSVNGIPEVECIGNEFYCDEEEEGNNMMKARGGGMVVLFPALEELRLYDMPSLEEWKGWSSSSSRMKEAGEAQVSMFPVLKKLDIYSCPMLVNLTEEMQNLTSLKSLTISRCDGLKSLNNCLQHLTNLHELAIRYCSELELLPDDFQNLVSLQSLHLVGLPKLAAVTVVGSSTLNGLKSLDNCLQLLTNLHELEISNCQKLELLPDDFQNLVSLQSLHLVGLPKLAAVPVLTNQRSLQTLGLYYCKNLKSLPEGLQHLTALEDLYITECHPELQRRCEQNTGEDWHKIAHIPHINLL